MNIKMRIYNFVNLTELEDLDACIEHAPQSELPRLLEAHRPGNNAACASPEITPKPNLV
jgi:hypothetical protein